MLESLMHSTQFLVYGGLALAAFVWLGASSLFGGDHDHDHDVDHDHDHGGDAEGAGSEPVVSIFSSKVIGAFALGFGAAGAIASAYNCGPTKSFGAGLFAGLTLGALAYVALSALYRQQANSLVSTSLAVGAAGEVVTAIPPQGTGEVGVTLAGQYQTHLAKSADGGAIARGRTVKVREISGGVLVVTANG